MDRVGVVGCGLMGAGIAEVYARSGAPVVLVDVDEERLAGGRSRIQSSMDRAVRAAKMEDADALLIPYLLSAIRMLESGFAKAEDIDTAMVEGRANPMGPLALADLIGLDTTAAVAASLYEGFKEPPFAPPPLLSRMVEAGLPGRKTGRGFCDHGRRK